MCIEVLLQLWPASFANNKSTVMVNLGGHLLLSASSYSKHTWTIIMALDCTTSACHYESRQHHQTTLVLIRPKTEDRPSNTYTVYINSTHNYYRLFSADYSGIARHCNIIPAALILELHATLYHQWKYDIHSTNTSKTPRNYFEKAPVWLIFFILLKTNRCLLHVALYKQVWHNHLCNTIPTLLQTNTCCNTTYTTTEHFSEYLHCYSITFGLPPYHFRIATIISITWQCRHYNTTSNATR